jgi:hypothetical protein
MRPLPALLFLFLLEPLTLLAPRAAHADAYDDAFVRAGRAEQRGDLAGAAQALASQVEAYPQDYSIALALGWTYFRAGRYVEAERAYRAAMERAPASTDARLGLAWSLVHEGRCDEASEGLRAHADTASSVPDCDAPRPHTWTLSAAWNEYLFPSHPYKASGTGFVAGVGATFGQGWTLGGAYRFVRFATTATTTLKPFAQNEGYFDAGITRPAFALLARGAVALDGTGAFGTSEHVGVSGRWTPSASLGLDLKLDGALSVYPDTTAARIAPSVRVHLVGPLSIVPGVAAQRVSGQSFWNTSLSLLVDTSRASLWVGGKYGEEARPAYLDAHVIYDVPERIEWGAWAGARVSVTHALGLTATYAFDRIRRTDALSPAESGVHAISFGPIVEF